jgi:hypothetical protein
MWSTVNTMTKWKLANGQTMVYKTPHTNDWAAPQQTTGELMSAVRVVSSIRHTLSEDDTIRQILLAPFGQEFMTEFC